MPMPLSGLAQTLSNSVASVQQQIVDTQDQLASGVKNLNPGQNGVVTRLSAQADGYSQVMTNIGTAQSVISVGQGALGSIATILTQMKSLATQAQSAGLTTDDANSMNATFTNLASQISTLKSGASVNGNNLLTGGTISVTTGIDGSSASNTTVSGVDVGSIATTASALSIAATTGASIITKTSQTTGIPVSSGTAAQVTFTVGTAPAAGETVIIRNAAAGSVLTATAGSGGNTVLATAQAIAAFINNGISQASGGTAVSVTGTGDFAVTGGAPAGKWTATVSSTGVITLTQNGSGNYGVDTLVAGGTNATTYKTTVTNGVAAVTSGTPAVDRIDFSAGAGQLTTGQSVTVAGLTFTASQTTTAAQLASAYKTYITTGALSAYGSFSGNSLSTMQSLYTAAYSGSNTYFDLTTTAAAASTVSVSGGTATANAQAAVVSLTTLLNTVSTGQSTLSAAATGLTAQTANANALKTGLSNTVNSIQNIDATAMQAKLQQLNNQQSIDYYLVSQMNTEAAAILSIFR
jgi:flagellin-like hook-associated protein FlgL